MTHMGVRGGFRGGWGNETLSLTEGARFCGEKQHLGSKVNPAFVLYCLTTFILSLRLDKKHVF